MVLSSVVMMVRSMESRMALKTVSAMAHLMDYIEIKSTVAEMAYVMIRLMDKYWVWSTILLSGVMMERLMKLRMALEMINATIRLTDESRIMRMV